MKSPAFLFLVFLLPGFALAATIDSPSAVPENASWGFTVDIGGQGSTASVSVDGQKVVEVFSSGAVVYQAFSPNVLNAYLYGNQLVVYHRGLGAGEHTISVESSSGNDSKTITSLGQPNPDEIYNDVSARIDSHLAESEQKLKNFEVDMAEFWKKTNENSDSLSSLSTSVSQLSEKVDGSSNSVDSLSQRVRSLEEEKAERDAALLAEEEARKNSPIAGFVGLAGELAAPIGIILVILAIAFIAFSFKDKLPKMDSVYTSRRDEYNLPFSKEHDEMAKELASDSGKWSLKK